MNYACAAGIGAVSGLRSMSGPAIVSEAASRNLVDLRNSPLSWLSSDRSARASAILAVGELIADKLPGMPNRTDAPALIFRAVSGAVCGYAVCGRGRSKHQAWMSAFVGATAAVATAWAGFEYRRRVKLPAFVAAIAEDAVAIGTGAAVISAIGR